MRIPGKPARTAERRGGTRRGLARQGARPLIFATLLAALGWLGVAGAGAPAPVSHAAPAQPAAGAHHTARRDTNPTLSLIQPANQPGGPQGPAGANIAARIQGAGGGTAFQLFYSAPGADCAAETMTQINGASFTTNDNGSLTFFFVWPAASGTGTFSVCAALGGSGTNIVQSSQTYQVLATASPTISLAPAPVATATPGGGGAPQGTPATGPNYTVGDQIIITGTGFLPGGTQVGVYISGVQTVNGINDLGDTLGNPFNTGTDGSFSTTVTLPAGRLGQEYIHVATTTSGLNGSKNYPPLLVASQFIQVNAATPTPTATATATATPLPHATPTVTPGNGGDAGTARILEVGGLGALSVLLLIVGAMLLVSAGRRP